MRINPNIAASAINRYTNVVRRQTAETQGLSTTDKIELSEQARLYSSLIQAARNSDDYSDAKVHAVLNRMASGTYQVHINRLAAKMMPGASEGEQDE